MRKKLLAAALLFLFSGTLGESKDRTFQTSDRCVACHNGMRTQAGEDFSIGLDWRASIMANSSRDPYWQASVRRETIDHPTASADIQNECSHCHMPMAFYHPHVALGMIALVTVIWITPTAGVKPHAENYPRNG